MRKFSIVFRDNRTNELHSVVVNHETLVGWMNSDLFVGRYKVCVVRELG